MAISGQQGAAHPTEPHTVYFNVFVYLTTVLSIFFNGFLLIAIKYSSSSYIGKYRYLSMLFCVFNIVYSLVHCWLLLVIHVYNDSFIVFSPMSYLSVMISRLATALFAAAFAQSLCLFAIHFIYRYVFTVKTQYRWIFDDKKSIIALIGFNCFVVIDYYFVCFYNFGKSDLKDDHWENELKRVYNVNISEYGYISALLSKKGEYQTKDLFGLLNVSLVIGTTFAVLPFCAISIYRKLAGVEILSDRLKTQQMKLFKVLLLQTILALVFTFIPSSAIIIGAACFFDPGYGPIVTLMLTVFSVVDPLILLYFVGCYRSAVKSAIHLKFPKQKDSTSIAPSHPAHLKVTAKNVIRLTRTM